MNMLHVCIYRQYVLINPLPHTHTRQVISALKKVTFGDEAKDEDEEISLDKGNRGRPRWVGF